MRVGRGGTEKVRAFLAVLTVKGNGEINFVLLEQTPDFRLFFWDTMDVWGLKGMESGLGPLVDERLRDGGSRPTSHEAVVLFFYFIFYFLSFDHKICHLEGGMCCDGTKHGGEGRGRGGQRRNTAGTTRSIVTGLGVGWGANSRFPKADRGVLGQCHWNTNSEPVEGFRKQ